MPLKELYIAFKYSGIRKCGSIAEIRQAWARHVTVGSGFNLDLGIYVYFVFKQYAFFFFFFFFGLLGLIHAIRWPNATHENHVTLTIINTS